MMNIKEEIKSIYVTQNEEAKAVLIETESYEKWNKAIGLLKIISQGEVDIKNCNFTDQKEFFVSIEKRLSTARI